MDNKIITNPWTLENYKFDPLFFENKKISPKYLIECKNIYEEMLKNGYAWIKCQKTGLCSNSTAELDHVLKGNTKYYTFQYIHPINDDPLKKLLDEIVRNEYMQCFSEQENTI